MSISVIQQWIAIDSTGGTIDATGADCLIVGNIAADTPLTTGKAIPTAMTYAGVDMLVSDGGTPGNGYAYRGLFTGNGVANSMGIWVLCAPATGSNSLSITQQAGTYGLGPRTFYCLLSGVDQSNPVRTGSVLTDTTLGTSISFAFTGLSAGDLLNAIGADFGDTAHTASGTGATLVLDSAANNNESVAVSQRTATGSAHTIGVASGTNLFGVGLPFIAATATAFTLTATGTSWAWTGTAAALKKASVLSAASASYSWAGQAVTLTRAFTMAAAAAAYDWTGQAASLLSARVLSAATESYAWTGSAVTFSKTFLLTALATAWSRTVAAVSFIAPFWHDTTAHSDTWTDASAASNPWSDETDHSDTWTDTTDHSDTWTDTTDHSDTWTDE